MTEVPLLIISGPVGVGKTSTGEEVSNILVRRNIAHTLIDLDCLAETYPRPENDKYGTILAYRNLARVWENCQAAGSKNLVVARVIESNKDTQAICSSVPYSKPIVCQLIASDTTLIDRVRKREIGSGLEHHEKRSLELASSLGENAPADFVVDTNGKTIVEIASRVVNEIVWAT
ncbi:MAG: hypothetical protein AAF423_08010 [Pseudomonadota bacterium]